MLLVILQDCPDGRVGDKVIVENADKARAMVRAGVARYATLKDHVARPMRADDVRVKGRGRNV